MQLLAVSELRNTPLGERTQTMLHQPTARERVLNFNPIVVGGLFLISILTPLKVLKFEIKKPPPYEIRQIKTDLSDRRALANKRFSDLGDFSHRQSRLDLRFRSLISQLANRISRIWYLEPKWLRYSLTHLVYLYRYENKGWLKKNKRKEAKNVI